MNTVLAYLQKNRNRLDLSHLSLYEQLSCIVATPNFKTSTHVLFFVLSSEKQYPLLVAKIPRIAGDNRQLDKEACNLRKVQALKAGGFESIPKVIAHEDWEGHRMLIETALEGEPIRPDFIRLFSQVAIEPVAEWITELHIASAKSNIHDQRWFERLVQTPIRQLEAVFASCSLEQKLIERTKNYISSLEFLELPLVFEHGDFCSPNILIGPNSRVSVVDWELAEPNGLPAIDFFFFLNFVAFSKKKAVKNSTFLSAFKDAFFNGDAWTAPYIYRYCYEMHLKNDALRPLFLLCWAKTIINLINRLNNNLNLDGTLTTETIKWLRENRYYYLWKYTIEHINKLNF